MCWCAAGTSSAPRRVKTAILQVGKPLGFGVDPRTPLLCLCLQGEPCSVRRNGGGAILADHSDLVTLPQVGRPDACLGGQRVITGIDEPAKRQRDLCLVGDGLEERIQAVQVSFGLRDTGRGINSLCPPLRISCGVAPGLRARGNALARASAA